MQISKCKSLCVRYASAVFSALLLSVALAQAPLPTGASSRAPLAFNDVQDSHWAYPAVDVLSRLGIVTGYPGGDYRGERGATRYELAVVAARLLDYTDQILGAVPNARFEERMRGDEVALGRTGLLGRVESLETALGEAASLSYVQRLERRVVAIEQNLNTESGTDQFPGVMEDGSQGERSAAELWAERGNGAAGQGGASGGPRYPFYLGIAPGVVSTSGEVYLGVQAGYDNLIGPVGVVSRLTLDGGNNELRLSLDALVRLDALTADLDLYGGLGAGYTFRPSGNALLLEIPFGAEYYVTPRVSLFGQLITSYGFAPVNSIDAGLTAGVNLRF